MHTKKLSWKKKRLLTEQKKTEQYSMSTVTKSTSSDSQWNGAFIPQVTERNKNKRECTDEFDPDPECCASYYDIEAILDDAYDEGLEDHPGVLALDNRSKACITDADLESLADDLAIRAYSKEEKSDKKPDQISGVPKGLDLSKKVVDVFYYPEIYLYCGELFHKVAKASYTNQKTFPEKTELGEKFEEVFNYCAKAMRDHLTVVEIASNNFMEGIRGVYKEQVEMFAHFRND